MAEDLRTITFDPKTQSVRVEDRPQEEDAKIARRERQILFYLIVVGLIIAFIAAAGIAFVVPATPENVANREWARSILSAIITGVIGHTFGKK
jgi:uncharacterized protein YqhQ